VPSSKASSPIKKFRTRPIAACLFIAFSTGTFRYGLAQETILNEVKVEASALTIGQPANEEGHKDYLITHSSSGSKTELPNSEVAQHITTVSTKLIEDQDLRSVIDAMKNVAGVNNTYPTYFPLDYMSNATIRGFQTSTILRDGLWDPTAYGNSWLGDVERIEVLKGPAGLLYGAYSGGIGGVINVVTKRPLKEPKYTFNVMTDSFGSKSISADLSHPLTDDGRWLARANINQGDYLGFAEHTNYTKRDASLIIQGLLTEQDAITLSAEKRYQSTRPYSGEPGYVVKGSGASASLLSTGSFSNSINVYDPRSSYWFDSDTFRLIFEHQFSPDWSFRSSNQYTETARTTRSISATPSLVGNTITYKESWSEVHMGPVKGQDSDNMVHGKFSTVGIDHDFIAGLRYARERYDMNMVSPNPNPFSSTTFTDPNNPTWGVPFGGLYRTIRGGNTFDQQFNMYVNDVIKVTEKLKFSLGLNHVDYKSQSESQGLNSSGNPTGAMSHSTNAVKGKGWRAGVLYDIRPDITVFTDYATTFQPQSPNITTDGNTQIFDSLSGEQAELGIKVDITDKASLTASIYALQLSNVLANDPDPTRSALGYKVQTGKQLSRGLELDSAYRLAKGWDLLASYAHTDVAIQSDQTYLSGSRVPNVPKDSLRLWTTYEPQAENWRGWGFGGGIRSVSNRTTNLVSKSTPNVVATLSGYSVADALVYYRFDKSKISFNLYNLFNRKYWESANSYTWLYPGEPVRAELRLQTSF